jgi:hypothetical protein
VRSRIFILLISIFVSTLAFGQEVKVRGQFLVDSTRIGVPVPFSLTAHHLKDQDILFPDSTFSFAPFEFHQKKFFTTITKDTLSYDSVVYYLSSFETDSLQKLRLPVFVVQPRDCTKVFSLEDSLGLIRMVHSYPDSVTIDKLPLKMSTAYQKVDFTLNYPLAALIGGLLGAILILVWTAFGKRIRKYYILKRLQKNHQGFLDRFNGLAEQLKSSLTSSRAEEALIVWKKYMEGLASKPFTKYTSKEIIAQEEDKTLGEALHSMDRFIYGGVTDFSDASFLTLRTYTEAQYHKKMEEIKNG